jgi:arylsulfatase A-like enzyme
VGDDAGKKETLFEDWVRQVNECVPAIDEGVGELIAALKATGQLENTLVIYTADQGFAMGEHGMRTKLAAWDANYRSPLIFSMPGTIPANKVCPQVANAPDLVATFFSLARIEPPKGQHGRDLMPLLNDPASKWDHPCFYEFTGEHYGSDVSKILKEKPKEAIYQRVPWYTSVVVDGWKLIHYLQPGVGDELYDLKNDPEELKNLHGKPEVNTQQKRLTEAMRAELKRTHAPEPITLPDLPAKDNR